MIQFSLEYDSAFGDKYLVLARTYADIYKEHVVVCNDRSTHSKAIYKRTQTEFATTISLAKQSLRDDTCLASFSAQSLFAIIE